MGSMKRQTGVSLLGIDYGTVRIGLSHADELGVPVPLPALSAKDERRMLEALGRVIREKKVGELVLGHPLNMDGSAGFKAREVEDFADRLGQFFSLPVHLVDERLTTHEVTRHMSLRQLRRMRASGKIDSQAAVVILRDYLEANPISPEGLSPRSGE